MMLWSIQCCFFYFYFQPLIVQSRPVPGEKNKGHATTHQYNEHNMYTDPRNPFYPGNMKTSKAFKIFLKIAWENFKWFWRFYSNRWNTSNMTYGPPAPPYGAYHGNVAPVPPHGYGAPVQQHGHHMAPPPAQPYPVTAYPPQLQPHH